ncbi:MAG: BACON domain-containing protein [Bacteroidales bacterium]|nr:BACON domain-containing protein [Bacteroidales bacterium]
MKLRYLIGAILLGLGLVTACTEEELQTLSELQLSESYVSIDVAGSTSKINVNATADWSVVAESVPEWLTVSPMSGAAGQTELSFTAAATTATRNAEVKILCNSRTQFINVIQYAAKVDPPVVTVAEALALIKAVDPNDGQSHNVDGTYRVRGFVTKITEMSTQYGNATYYLSDDGVHADGKVLQVYRGLWKNGAAITTGNEFGVGDELVIEAQLMSYKGTPETVEKTAIVIEHTPSIIQVESITPDVIPADGGEVEVKVSSKVSPIIVSTDVAWLTVTDVKEGNVYVLTAAANDYTAIRSATITVKGPGAIATKSIKQEGIPATGATVTEIIAMDDNSEIETLESTVIAKTTKGVVISDGTNALYVYGTKVDDVNVGDNVKVIAKKTSYNGVPEIVFTDGSETHQVIVYSSGNKFDNPTPVDITANAGEYTANKAEYIKLTGTLSVSGTYYNLALDAFPGGDKQGSIVFPVEELAADSFKDKKITVTGWFNGLSSKGKYINIIATKIVEFQDNPKGTLTNPYSPSEIATLLVGGTTFSENVYIKGIVSRKTTYNYGPTYNNASFWISDDGVAYGISEDGKKTTEPTKDFECYSVYWLGGDLSAPTAAADIKGNFEVGDEVVIYGAVTLYAANNLAETQKNKAKIYSINGAESDENGLGNASYPFNIAGIEAFIDRAVAAKAAAAASEQEAPVFPDVCVKGKISAVLYAFDTAHENGTFWISDDGVAHGISSDNKKTTEPAKDFECYNVYWLNNVRWAEGDAQPAVGDEVIIKGQYTLYSGTYETAGKKAWVYSHTPATN